MSGLKHHPNRPACRRDRGGRRRPSEEIITAARNRAVTGARNIAGLARIDQIVASSLLIRELPKRSTILSRVMSDLGRLKGRRQEFRSVQVDWLTHEEHFQRHGVNVDPTPSQIPC